MNLTRRESLRLFGSGLAGAGLARTGLAGSAVEATAMSVPAQPGDAGAPGKALDRAQLLQLLGRVPAEAPSLAPEQVERVDLGDLVREKVTYAVEIGERVPAFVFIPKAGIPKAGIPKAGIPKTEIPKAGPPNAGLAHAGAGRYPAVLCHHQHGGEFQVGKDGPAGLGSNANQHYAIELARRGYVTLVFDALCFNERQDATGKLKDDDYERYEGMYRLTEGKTLQGKYVWDSRRALDYLETRPEVDRARIGMIGHSLGGQETLFTTAIDTRIRAAASSCGFASFRAIKREHINHNYALFVPGLANYGGFGAVLSLVAPRPFLAAARTTDPIFPKDGIDETVAAGQRAYAAAGAADRLSTFFEPGEHTFSPAMRQAAYEWLDRWLTAAG